MSKVFATQLGLTKADLHQGLGIIVKYPLVMIKVDDKIRRLVQASA